MSAIRVIGTGFAVGAVVLVMTLLGFEHPNIALAAAAVAVVGAFLGQWELGGETSLPQLQNEGRAGRRHEISQLSWALTDRDGRVTGQGMRQLRSVAAGRLASIGVDPDDDDAVAAALGARGLRTLRATEPPTTQALNACLIALENLQGARS